MQNYIYLNFSDLSEEKQEELIELAREEVKSETIQEEADDVNMRLDDLVSERIDGKLLE